ncbi:hypothetical protein [Poriferisphaera sp. WC338]|uniref:hypothetical protein n=1 Tax=Poriferisphaera sp. WC338 TaxID=3425129 RepID=UPI003D816D9A
MIKTATTSLSALAVLAAANSIWVGTANADLLAYEGFDYERVQYRTDTAKSTEAEQMGGIAGLNGGIGFAGAWRTDSTWDNGIATAGTDYPTPGLPTDARTSPASYTDSQSKTLEQQGNALRTGFANYTRSHRTLNEELGAAGTEVWISFIAQAFGDRGSRYSFVSFGKGGDGEAGSPGGNLRMGMDSSASTKWNVQQEGHGSAEGTIDSGSIVMYLARIQFNDFDPFNPSGGKDKIDVWFNPDLENAPVGNGDLSFDLEDDLKIDSITVWSRYSTDFDEIRIGTTFDDVTPVAVPEASAASLLIGFGTILGLRRKH